MVLVGPEAVGKTALRRQYMGLGFEEQYKMTFGADVSHKSYLQTSSNTNAWVSIWDLAGQHEFKKMRQYYISGTVGAFLVLNCTYKVDSEDIEWWGSELKQNLNQKHFFIAILLNKQDLEDQIQISDEDIVDIESKLSQIFEFSSLDFTMVKIKSFKTSAKTGEGVDVAFDWMIDASLTTILEEEETGSY